jgi:shikimate 5-dehydrogenase
MTGPAPAASGTGDAGLPIHPVTGRTRVYLHLAHPSSHVRTPQVMNRAFTDRGIDAVAPGTGPADPAGHDLVINATPLGMKPGDPLPMDIDRISPQTFVGEVVMKQEFTPFLTAAKAKGCPVQVGTDMLFEMIPAYLEFFGFKTTTPEVLREVAQIKY